MAILPLSGLSDINARIEEYRSRTGMSPTADMVRAWSQPVMASEAQRQIREQAHADKIAEIQQETGLGVRRVGLQERQLELEQQRRELEDRRYEEAVAQQNQAGSVNAALGLGKAGLSLYSMMGSSPTTTVAPTGSGVSYGVMASDAGIGTAGVGSALGPLTGETAMQGVGQMLTPYLAAEGAGTAVGTGMGGAAAGAETGAAAGSGIGPWGLVIGAVLGGLMAAIFGRRG